MQSPNRAWMRWILLLMVAGLLLVAGMALAHWKTLPYRAALVMHRMVQGIEAERPRSAYRQYQRRQDQFARLTGSADIAIIGDSIVSQGEWTELLPGRTVHNRGIGNDTIAGVAARLDTICARRYPTVVLMIGVNDVLISGLEGHFRRQYADVVRRLKICSGRVLVHPILPMAASRGLNNRVGSFNFEIREIAEAANVQMVDLRSDLAPDGNLRSDVSNDGIHLNGIGYLVWARRLREALDQPH